MRRTKCARDLRRTVCVDPSASLPIAQAFSALLIGAVGAGCSDVHLHAGSAPWGRQNGRILKMNTAVLSAEEILDAIRISSQREVPQDAASFEYSFDHGAAFRLRCHAFRDSEGWALAIRIVPAAVPSFLELRLPPVIKVFAQARPGLVLVTGPMGSGKSTTAAAMLQYLASQEAAHIVTLEEPIEYRISGAQSCVHQREIGRDTPNIQRGLKDALREDADILFVGELRDANDLAVALHAADMGISVLATLHTHGALATANRLIAMHPVDQQPNARERIADSLRGVISQRLVPRRGGKGRVLATEVLVNNFSAKECLRDVARSKGLTAVIERGSDQGMHTLDQSLLSLCSAGLIDVEVAASIANSPANLKRALNLGV